jgi:predicted ester cyclase
MGPGEAMVRRINYEGYVGLNPSVVFEVLSDDYIEHDLPFTDMGDGREFQKTVLENIIAAFSEMTFEYDEYVEVGDTVVENWKLTIKHDRGPFMGVEPTGKTVEARGIDIFRVRGDRLVEHWGVLDTLALAQSIGAIPVA